MSTHCDLTRDCEKIIKELYEYIEFTINDKARDFNLERFVDDIKDHVYNLSENIKECNNMAGRMEDKLYERKNEAENFERVKDDLEDQIKTLENRVSELESENENLEEVIDELRDK